MLKSLLSGFVAAVMSALFVVVAVASLVLVVPVSRLMRWALITEGNRRSLVPANANEGGIW